MTRIDLFGPLRAKGLLPDYEVANTLRIHRAPFRELVELGFGPPTKPAFASGYFWFRPEMVAAWRYWALNQALYSEIAVIEATMRKHDTLGDNSLHDDLSGLAFVTFSAGWFPDTSLLLADGQGDSQ